MDERCPFEEAATAEAEPMTIAEKICIAIAREYN
jgi:hypothetical protein